MGAGDEYLQVSRHTAPEGPTMVDPMYRVRWAGPWPPPEQMLLVVARFDFTWSTAEIDERKRQLLLQAGEHQARIYRLQRRTYSQISDADIKDMSHVARGAEYDVVGEWTPETQEA